MPNVLKKYCSYFPLDFCVICDAISTYILCATFMTVFLLLFAVLSTVLQMAGVGFTVGTLATFLRDQVYKCIVFFNMTVQA